MTLHTPTYKTIDELLGLSQKYGVPDFQRDYSWKDEHIIAFMEDLFETWKTNRDDPYFFGAMLFIKSKNSNPKLIVDGQQRIASFCILLSVVRDLLYTKNLEDNAVQWAEEKVVKKSIRGEPDFYRLELNYNDKEFFRDFVLKQDTIQNKINSFNPKYPSQKKIYTAYQKILELILEQFGKDISKNKKGTWIKRHDEILFQDTRLNNATTADEKKQIKKDIKNENKQLQCVGNLQTSDLIEFIEKSIIKSQILEITVESEEEAFTVFATLNERGLNLATVDLVKNYLFKQLSNDLEREEYTKKWISAINVLDRKELDNFLLHFWMSRYNPRIKVKKLYHELSTRVNSPEEAKQILENLEMDAETYSNIIDPAESFWNNEEIVSNIDELNVLKSKAVRPLLLTAKRIWGENTDELNRLVKNLAALFFRAKTIFEKPETLIVKTMNNIAYDIEHKHIDNEEVKKQLKEIDVSDEDFQRRIQFDHFDGTVAKYILRKIDAYEKGKFALTEIKNKKLSLEHILPINPIARWYDDFSKEEQESYLERIGNLALLHSFKNSEIKNKYMDDKKNVYAKQSDIINTLELAEKKTWTKDDIEERSKKFAEKAIDIWKLE